MGNCEMMVEEQRGQLAICYVWGAESSFTDRGKRRSKCALPLKGKEVILLKESCICKKYDYE